MSEGAVMGSAPNAVVAELMSGDVFSAIADDRLETRTARLETVLRDFVDDGTRVVWVGNPLRSPLTMERFLLQIAGPEVDLRFDREPAELARLIAQRIGSETRLLVVVQQPETINPETLEQLGALAGHLGGEPVQVQFLFVGASSLRLPTVDRAALAPLLPLLPPAAPPEPEPAGSRRRDVLPLALLLILTTIGVIVSLWPPAQVPTTPAPLPQPPIAAATTPAPVEVRLPPAPTLAAADDIDTLRRRFDQFLAERSRSLPPLSEAQKNALFDDFLTHHRRE